MIAIPKWYDYGMTMPVQKLSVSLDPADVAWAKAQARTLGLPLSAYLSQLIAREQRRQAGLAALAWYEDERGPISEGAMADANEEADAIFGPIHRGSAGRPGSAGTPGQKVG